MYGISCLCYLTREAHGHAMQDSREACRCIMCLIFIVALAIIAAIVIRVLDLGGDNLDLPGPDDNDDSNGDVRLAPPSSLLLPAAVFLLLLLPLLPLLFD